MAVVSIYKLIPLCIQSIGWNTTNSITLQSIPIMNFNKVRMESNILERKRVIFSRLLISSSFSELERWNVLDFSPGEVQVQLTITVQLTTWVVN